VVNLHAIALQLRHLARQRAKMSDDSGGEMATRLEHIFTLDTALPDFVPTHLSLFNHGRDDVLQGLEASVARLEALRHNAVAPALLQNLITLAQDVLVALDTTTKSLKDVPITKGYSEPPVLFELAQQYCTLHAAAACIHMWVYNRTRLSAFFASGEWLALCLHRLLRALRPMPAPLSGAYTEGMAEELVRLYEDQRLFSMVPFRLAGGVSV
jgi:hypothetical protein